MKKIKLIGIISSLVFISSCSTSRYFANLRINHGYNLAEEEKIIKANFKNKEISFVDSVNSSSDFFSVLPECEETEYDHKKSDEQPDNFVAQKNEKLRAKLYAPLYPVFHQTEINIPEENEVGSDEKPKPPGTTAFVFSLIGLIGGFLPPYGILFSLTAIILGIVALRKIKKNPGKYSGKSRARWAIILGIAGIIISVITTIIIINTLMNSLFG